MKQGPGWSPNGGKYWVRDDFIYWHDGNVGQISKDEVPCRVGMHGCEHDEDYSAWTDEHRAAVKKESDDKRSMWRQMELDSIKAREILVASAKLKLTEDEFNAVFNEGRDY